MYGPGGLKLEINIPSQQIRAKWKGGLINEWGVLSSEYGKYMYMLYMCMVSLVPRLLCGGGGKRAWYTLFAHAPSSLGNLHTTSLY